MDKEKKEVAKPVSVARQEFIEKLIDLINSSQLSAFVLYPIMKDVANDLANSANQQYLAEKKQYEDALKEMKNESENS
jgi:hypothetical protein